MRNPFKELYAGFRKTGEEIMSEKLQRIAIGMGALEQNATPPTPGQFRMTKSEVGYGTPARGEDLMRCLNCLHLRGTACARVHGSVDPNKVCDLYESKDD